jgi:hypothetical protein
MTGTPTDSTAERCDRCRRKLSNHGTAWDRREGQKMKLHICPQIKGQAVGGLDG